MYKIFLFYNSIKEDPTFVTDGRLWYIVTLIMQLRVFFFKNFNFYMI